MSGTTRWIDNSGKTFCEVLDQIKMTDKSFLGINPSTQIEYTDLIITETFPKYAEIEINDKTVIYNLIRVTFSKVLPNDGKTSREDRLTRKKCCILIYSIRNEEDNNKVFYIINKNSDALWFLRQLMDYTGQNAIVEEKIQITSKFILWLISKVYKKENIFDDDLTIDTVIGFKGSTQGVVNTINVSGDSVVNILSTLSFILESKLLQQIAIRLKYGEHENIELKLDTKCTIDIDMKEYVGIYENDNDDARLAKLLLIVYMELLPIIKEWYYDNAGVNSEYYKHFCEKVAKDLKKKIDIRIADGFEVE